jgi:hypothetical protein
MTHTVTTGWNSAHTQGIYGLKIKKPNARYSRDNYECNNIATTISISYPRSFPHHKGAEFLAGCLDLLHIKAYGS